MKKKWKEKERWEENRKWNEHRKWEKDGKENRNENRKENRNGKAKMYQEKRDWIPRAYDQYVMKPRQLRNYYICAAGMLGIASWLFFQNIFFALALPFISIPLKKYHIRSLAKEQQSQLSDQFRDLLYSISASTAAGRQLREALMEAEENLAMIYEPEAPIRLELNQMGRRMREGRESEEQLLQDFALRSKIEDIENFVEVCLICRRTGGSLEKMVKKASEVIRDKMEIQRELRMLTAQKRLEIRLLTALPFLVIFFLRITSPDYFTIMDHTGIGRILMGLSLLGIGISYGISMKLIQIPI